MYRIGQTKDQGDTVHSYLFVITTDGSSFTTVESVYRDRSFDYDRNEGCQTDFIFKVG